MSDDEQDAGGVTVPVVAEPVGMADGEGVAGGALVPMSPRAGRVVPLAEARLLAEEVFQSNLFPKKIQRASQALVILLTGWEMGIGFMASLRAIHIIDGQVSLAADLQKALVKRNGQSRFTYDYGEGYCELFAERLDTGESITVRWDRERVERSKVSFSQRKGVKDNWAHHEPQMLRHRCDSEATGILWPDVVLNVYAPEELEFAAEAAVVTVPGQGAGAMSRTALGLPPAQGSDTEGPGADTEAGADGAPAADDQTPGPEGDDNDTRLSASNTEGPAPLFDIDDDEVPLDEEGE